MRAIACSEDHVRATSIRERQQDFTLRRQRLTIEVTSSGRVVLRLKTTSNGRSYHRQIHSAFQRVVSRSVLKAGSSEWHHIAAVIGPSKLELFVNGVLEGSLPTSTVVPRGPALIIGDRHSITRPSANNTTMPADLMPTLITAALRSRAAGTAPADDPVFQTMLQWSIQSRNLPPGVPRPSLSSRLFGPLQLPPVASLLAEAQAASQPAASSADGTSTHTAVSAAPASSTALVPMQTSQPMTSLASVMAASATPPVEPPNPLIASLLSATAQPPSAKPRCMSVAVSVRHVRVYNHLLSADAVREVMRSHSQSPAPQSAVTADWKHALSKCHKFGAAGKNVAPVKGELNADVVAGADTDIATKASDLSTNTEFTAAFRCLTSLKCDASCLALSVNSGTDGAVTAAATSTLTPLSDLDENNELLRRVAVAGAVALRLALAQRAAWLLFLNWRGARAMSEVVSRDVILQFVRGAASGAVPWHDIPQLTARMENVPEAATDSKVDSVVERDSKDDDDDDDGGVTERKAGDERDDVALTSHLQSSSSSPLSAYTRVVEPLIRSELRAVLPSGESTCGSMLSETVGHLLWSLHQQRTLNGDVPPPPDIMHACNVLDVFVNFATRTAVKHHTLQSLVFNPRLVELILRNLPIAAFTPSILPPAAAKQSRDSLSLAQAAAALRQHVCLSLLRLCTAMVRGAADVDALPLTALTALEKGFQRFISMEGMMFKAAVFVGDITQQLVTLFTAVRVLRRHTNVSRFAVDAGAPTAVTASFPPALAAPAPHPAIVSIVPITEGAAAIPPPPQPVAGSGRGHVTSSPIIQSSAIRSPLTAPRAASVQTASPTVASPQLEREWMPRSRHNSFVLEHTRTSPHLPTGSIASTTSPIPPNVFAMEPDGSAALVPIAPGDMISESENEDESDTTTQDGAATDEDGGRAATTPSPTISPQPSWGPQASIFPVRRQSPFAAALQGSWNVLQSAHSRMSPLSAHHTSDHEDPDLDASSVRRVRRRRRRQGSLSSTGSDGSSLYRPRASSNPLSALDAYDGSPRVASRSLARSPFYSSIGGQRQHSRPSLHSDSDGDDTPGLDAADVRSWTAPGGQAVRAHADAAASSALLRTTSPSDNPMGSITYAAPSSIRAILSMAAHDRARGDVFSDGALARADGSPQSPPVRSAMLRSGMMLNSPSIDPLQSIERSMLATAIARSLQEALPKGSDPASLANATLQCPAELLDTVYDIMCFTNGGDSRGKGNDAVPGWSDACDRALVLFMNAMDSKSRQSGVAGNVYPSMVVIATPTDAKAMQSAHNCLQSVSVPTILRQAAKIQAFNHAFGAVFPFMDLTLSPSSLFTPSQLAKLRCSVILAQKDDILRRCISATQPPDFRPSVTLNRFAAIKHPNRNMFRQLMRQLEAVSAPGGDSQGYLHALRSAHSGNRPWHVRAFVGEHGLDLGGLFNSSLTEAIEAAMGPSSYTPVPLFLPTPNNTNGTGRDRDKLTFHPQAVTPQHLAMFRFLGQLIGVTIRLSFPVDVRLSPLFWRAVVNDKSPQTLQDLECIDIAFVEHMRRLQGAVATGDSSALEHLTMSTVLSDGTVHELVPRGSTVRVTLDKLPQYIELATAARLAVSNFRCHVL